MAIMRSHFFSYSVSAVASRFVYIVIVAVQKRAYDKTLRKNPVSHAAAMQRGAQTKRASRDRSTSRHDVCILPSVLQLPTSLLYYR